MQMLLAALFYLGPLGHAERYEAFAAARGRAGAAADRPQTDAGQGAAETAEL
jgi:hypothetical protein